MLRLMAVTFAFLAWAFYELSGGADFDPDRARSDASRHDPLKPVATAEASDRRNAADDMRVTRVSLDLTSVEDVLTENGTRRVGTRLPQQETRPAVAEETASDSTEIIPSLIENATPEATLAAAAGANDDIDEPDPNSGGDIRVVDGNRVNVRSGPGTNYGVVDTLIRGERVEVLDDTGNGWVRMRATESGTMGWMADFLLADG